MNTKEKQILELFLPEGVLEWFDVISGEKTGEEIHHITLEEKNIPPVTEKERGKKVISKGLKELNILAYFEGRSTNASAESFNAKIKGFRVLVRGVTDKKFFLYRISKIYA